MSRKLEPYHMVERNHLHRLIIHADDFGLSPSVNRGILSAMQNGVVTSTSLLANGSHKSEALESAREYDLDVGWHLNLVEGRPVSPPEAVPSLVGTEGYFHPPGVFLCRAFLRRLDVKDLCTEFDAQWRVFQEAGLSPSHLDGHMHMHLMPGVREALRDWLRDHPIRFLRCPRERGGFRVGRWTVRSFLGALKGCRPEFWGKKPEEAVAFYGLSLSTSASRLEAWRSLLSRIQEDRAEVMVHPAQGEDSPQDGFLGFQIDRSREWELLTGPELKNLIRDRGFQLSDFRRL